MALCYSSYSSGVGLSVPCFNQVLKYDGPRVCLEKRCCREPRMEGIGCIGSPVDPPKRIDGMSTLYSSLSVI